MNAPELLPLDPVEQFATLDPDVDWPSAEHASAAEALCVAVDALRDRTHVVLGHVERGLQHVRNGLAILGPQLPTSTGKAARAERELNAGAVALKSALIHAGELPAGAALVDERPHLDPTPPADGGDLERPTVDRARIAAARVVLNLSAGEAADLLEVLEEPRGRRRDHARARLAGVLGRLRERVPRAREYADGGAS